MPASGVKSSMESHKITPSLVQNLCFLFFLMFVNVKSKLSAFAESQDPYVSHYYTRFTEVEKACKPVLSHSSSSLNFDVKRANSIKAELSFIKGDWRQELGESPLMPFDDSDLLQNSSIHSDPLRLVTFNLTHFDPDSHGRSINIRGALSIGLSRRGTVPVGGPLVFPGFRIWPGASELVIVFEGVYTESEENGGERVLCLLGHSKLPSRQQDSVDPWDWATKKSNSSNIQPQLVQDDNILLNLRYPKTFMLTSRAIRGELRSLNDKSSRKYFDDVHLTSKLGAYSNYQFASEKFIYKACDNHYPNQTESINGKNEVYKGDRFCARLDSLVSGEFLNVVPNWNCNSTDEYCSKLGPFESNQEIKASDRGFANVGLLMQDVRCEQIISAKNSLYARVSAVFRVVPPLQNQYWNSQRSGLDGSTLSAEGIWNSSTGQLCMVSCLGLAKDGCHSRIYLYVPTSFSIRRRNLLFGKISSINETNSLYYPLTFELPVHPSQLSMKFSRFPPPAYIYSKIKFAGAFLERSEPFEFSIVIKKSLLSYPKKGDERDERLSLSNLADDLTLYVYVVPDPLPENRVAKPFLQLEILTIGSFFHRFWAYQNASTLEGSDQSFDKASTTEKQLLLNVSAKLSLSEKPYSNVSLLYLEGLYNPIDGKMYLIGCRDARASWKILFDSMDLEDGLDCLIEVKVEYPPTTARWFMNPMAKVFITSKRNDDDPLHFSPIKLRSTLPIWYQKQKEDILSRRAVEGILCILTLSMAIACIWSQLFYIRDSSSVLPYISLIMLGVQALGYSIPLITGAETLFARIANDSYERTSQGFEKNEKFQIFDYMVKILVLSAFLLTIRLGQKVWKSRSRLLTHSPLEPRRVPSDRNVFLISLIIHFIGFLVVFIVHRINDSRRATSTETYIEANGNRHKSVVQIEEYIGLVQDFFLLPQIIGNYLWRGNCKPLRKVYYVGITLVRILPHIYDYLRGPVFNPYFPQDYEFVNPSLDFYSKFGDIAIPVAAIVFAVIIFIQQRWRYEKHREGVQSSQTLHSGVYEKLPSIAFEAELVSCANETPMEDTLSRDGN
ncbi:hypothetical protein KFK09_017237 [Dendrobium nobile]|uniref:RING-type E3 ubiquitin transferase n=1 Tax=Dendrobium nobile TaxID=94219 RepID=A0A8T3B1S2_DENNO|nr:hypothetical protein KFK09_017237 [Dendrobium nobile]